MRIADPVCATTRLAGPSEGSSRIVVAIEPVITTGKTSHEASVRTMSPQD